MKKVGGQKGFTLVELMVVIAIMVILAVVLIMSFSGVTTKAKVTKTKGLIGKIVGALQSYYGDPATGRRYPGNNLTMPLNYSEFFGSHGNQKTNKAPLPQFKNYTDTILTYNEAMTDALNKHPDDYGNSVRVPAGAPFLSLKGYNEAIDGVRIPGDAEVRKVNGKIVTIDAWKHPLRYRVKYYATGKNNRQGGIMRREYELFSLGPDGDTSTNRSQKAARDDITSW